VALKGLLLPAIALGGAVYYGMSKEKRENPEHKKGFWDAYKEREAEAAAREAAEAAAEASEE
jgi:hypothetical protein